jgi:Flp pilus assembly protein TadG
MRFATIIRNRRRGAALAEMAVLLPLVASMFLVAVDFCRVFNCTQTVQGCAEAACLYASGNAQADSNVSVQTAAYQAALAEGTMLNPPLATGDVSVTIANGVATVTVTYNFQTFVGYPGVPRPLPVVRSAQLAVVPAVGQ